MEEVKDKLFDREVAKREIRMIAEGAVRSPMLEAEGISAFELALHARDLYRYLRVAGEYQDCEQDHQGYLDFNRRFYATMARHLSEHLEQLADALDAATPHKADE